MAQNKDQLTLFRSEEETKIKKNCYEHFHTHDENKFDVVRYFDITENIIRDSIKIIQSAIESTDLKNEKSSNVGENSFPSDTACLLKCISCKMTCGKDPNDINALEKSTEKILTELKGYSWEAKAVLGLAAFSLDYGEVSLLTYLYGTDEKIKQATSIPICKRVSGLLKNPSLLKSKQSEIKELNGLISDTLEVTRCIHELQQLAEMYDPRDVPSLTKAIKSIPVTVYRSIVTLVACATKLTQLLTSDDDTKKPREDLISLFVKGIKLISISISEQLEICKTERDEAVEYSNLKKSIDFHARDAMEVITILKLWNDVLPKSTFDGKEVDISELKETHVVLLFTKSLDISAEEIAVLKPICKRKVECALVWVPIVKDWKTNDQIKKRNDMFEKLTTSFKMSSTSQPSSFFTVQYSSTKTTLKYITEEWSCYDFKDGNTATVLINPEGEVVKKGTTARQFFHLYKLNELPFTCPVSNRYPIVQKKWILETVMQKVAPTLILDEWTRDKNKYILYYGGRDNAWIQEFRKKADIFKTHADIKKLNISIELVSVVDTRTVEAFWSEIENLFYSIKAAQNVEVDPSITKEIRKLFSYKYEPGWAVLAKGSGAVVTTGHGSAIYKVVDNFETKWKDLATDQVKFESYFIQQHEEVRTEYCCGYEFRSDDVYTPDALQCPICSASINKSVICRYRCCHQRNIPVA